MKLEKDWYFKRLLLATCAAMPMVVVTSMAYAAPEGGTVTQGSATISSSDKLTTIKQTTDRALIDWRGFDLAPDEAAKFVQPSATSLTINRVNSANPTVIQGKLSANGNIVLVNPNGVMFTPTSQVDVNGLVATTSNIRNEDFAAGKLEFSEPGNPNAVVANEGLITAKDAGLVGLVAPNVINSGVIQARLGKVQLASGDTFAIDLNGDGLVNIELSDDVKSQLVVNAGAIQAAGGTIEMTAAAGREAVNSLVLASGMLSAPTAEMKNGRIVIAAEGSNAVKGNIAADKGKKSGDSLVLVDADINASGRGAGEKGGSVEITGDHVVLLDGTFIDASGDKGGGDIKIGGDYLGGGTTATAATTSVGKDVIIANDAVTKGDGGRTILWADDTTEFYGNIFGRGGAEGGNGGFVETSGKKYLDAQGFVDLTAPKGNKGSYLLDPQNIAIYGNVDPKFVSSDGTTVNLANGLSLWLDSADRSKVTLTYSADSLTGSATGVSGSKLITTSADLSSKFAVGSRIRLTAAGAVATADTLGANTYTIAAISGTQITTVETLSTNYSATTLYRGLVSQWTDKSTFANNATQTNIANMPLWVGSKVNGRDVIQTDGDLTANKGDFMTVADANSLDATTGLSIVLAHTPSTVSSSNPGGIISKRIVNGGGGEEAYSVFYYTGQKLNIDMPSSSQRLVTTSTYASGAQNFFSIVYDGTKTVASDRLKVYSKGISEAYSGTSPLNSLINSSGPLTIGALGGNASSYQKADFQDVILHTRALANNERILLEQYMAAKWNNTLGASGTTLSHEVANATNASTGYSVFTTDYLERLSQTADVTLKATKASGVGGNITLDLKNDSLDFTTANRSLTLDAEGNILTASAGSINTNGGNITFKASDGILLNHALGLTTNGGNIVMSNNITLGANQTWDAGTGSITASGTINGPQNITATAGSIIQNAAWGGSAALAAVNLTTTSSIILDSIRANAIRVTANGATSDITIANGKVLNAANAATAIRLVAGRNFYNLAGSGALLAPAGKWLVYSTNPASDTIGGLNNDFRRFSCTFGGACPTLGTGNGLLYSYTPIVTVTSGALNLTYGDAIPSLSAYATTKSNYLGSDASADVVTGSLVGSTNYTAGSNVGTYRVNYVSGTLTSAMGYGFTYADNASAITVAKKDITVAFTSPLTKVYGSANPSIDYSDFTFTGLVDAAHDALFTSVTPDWNGVTTLSNVGTYTIGATVADTSNYNITTNTVAGSLEVTKKDITVAFTSPLTKVYGSANPSIDYSDFTFTGLVDAAHDALFTSVTPDWNGVTNLTDVGMYTIGATVADTSNYNITTNTVAGSLGITKKDITVAFTSPLTKVYGSANPSIDYSDFTFTGLVDAAHNADFTSVTADWNGVTTLTNVGTYTIGATVADTGNYNITTNTVAGSLGITKKDITVAFTAPLTKVYGSANPTIDYSDFTFTGLVDATHNADFTSVTADWNGVTSLTNVGTYTIGATVADTSNYNITTNTVAGSLGITKKDITVAFTSPLTKVYGSANPSIDYSDFTFTGLVDAAHDALFTSVTPDWNGVTNLTNVGTYTIGATVADTSNYNITTNTVAGSLGVTKKDITVAFTSPLTKVYGSANPTIDYSDFTFTGLVDAAHNADFTSVTPDWNGVTNLTNVGTYTIGATVADTSNYNITTNTVAGTLGITKRALTIKANDASRIEGAANPAFTASFTGLTAWDTPSIAVTGLTFATAANPASIAGNYAIEPQSATSQNYLLTFANGVLEVLAGAVIPPTPTPEVMLPNTVVLTTQDMTRLGSAADGKSTLSDSETTLISPFNLDETGGEPQLIEVAPELEWLLNTRLETEKGEETMIATQMETVLRNNFTLEELQIKDDSSKHAGHAGSREGGETHFRVTLVSSDFEGKSRVDRQRAVNTALKQLLAERVHALQLSTYTPAEYAALPKRNTVNT